MTSKLPEIQTISNMWKPSVSLVPYINIHKFVYKIKSMINNRTEIVSFHKKFPIKFSTDLFKYVLFFSAYLKSTAFCARAKRWMAYLTHDQP